jgi:prepilin-type N-terminal cleavage/methylation domain-containing protein
MSINSKQAGQRGFTLIELMMVVLLLSIVVGAVFSQIERAQVRYRVEDQKVDLTQQEREFIDQFTRDLHQAGYPSTTMFGGQYGTSSSQTAVGVWSLSATDLHMAGNVDGNGVQSIALYFDGAGWPGPGPSRPALAAQRDPKSGRRSAAAQAAGTAYTQVQVIPIASQPIFAAFDKTGSPIDLTATITDAPTLATIKSVQITVTTQGLIKDSDAHKDVQVSMTGMARLVNN